VSARIEWARTTKKGHILAVFDLYYGSFKINDFRIMENTVTKGQVWVAFPSKAIGPATNRRHITTVWIMDKDKEKAFCEWAIAAYYKEVKGD
jgi:hypothetical protein